MPLTILTNYPASGKKCPNDDILKLEIETAVDSTNWKPTLPAAFASDVGVSFGTTPLLTCDTQSISWTLVPAINIEVNSYMVFKFPSTMNINSATSSILNGLIKDAGNSQIVGQVKSIHIKNMPFSVTIDGIKLPPTTAEFNMTVSSYTNFNYSDGEMVHRAYTSKFQPNSNTLTGTPTIAVSPTASTVGEISTYTVTIAGACSDIASAQYFIAAPSVFTANANTCSKTFNCDANQPFTTIAPKEVLLNGGSKTLSFQLINPSSEKPVADAFEITVSDDKDRSEAFRVNAKLNTNAKFIAGKFVSFSFTSANAIAAENCLYTFTIGVTHRIAQGGYFNIVLNRAVGWIAGTSVYINDVKTAGSYDSGSGIITISVPSNIEAGTKVYIKIENLRNPIVMGTYTGFSVISLDKESYQIDTSDSLSIKMTDPGIGKVTVNINNPTNLATTKYDFVLASPNFDMPYGSINYLKTQTPIELSSCGTPTSSTLTSYLNNGYSFIISGAPTRTLEFSITCTNRGITTPTSNFIFTVYDSSASEILIGKIATQTTTGSPLSTYSLSCTTKCPRCTSVCTVAFTRINTTPIRIIVVHSSSLNPSSTSCSAIMPTNPSSSCAYDSSEGALILTFISTASVTSFTIGNVNVINPDYDSKDGSAFSIKTYNTLAVDKDFLVDQNDNVGALPVLCNYPCLDCQTNAPNTCTSCTKDFDLKGYYYLYTDLMKCQQLTASENCNTGYFKDVDNFKCVKCDVSCVSCLNFATYCTECVLPNYAFQGACALICPDGTYSDPMKGICQNCLTSCTKCSNSASYCSQCKAGYFYYNHQCLDKCPDNTFASGNQCLPCDGNCLTCSITATSCKSCDSNLYLSNTQCVDSITCTNGNKRIADSITNKCVPCTSPCSQCVDSVTKCASCISNAFLYNSQCLPKCPDGYYGNDGICTPCTSPCATCSGSSTTCYSCINGMYLLSDKFTCAASCSSEYYVSGTTCIPCESPCKTCQDSSTTCKSCVPNFYLYSNKCLSSCPGNSYLEVDHCVACDSSCLTCQFASSTCTSCGSGKFLDSSSCLASCPPGKFGSNRVCQSCNLGCFSCSGSAEYCTACNNGKLAHGGSCIDSCPVKTVANDLKNMCADCEAGCEVCTWTESGQSLPCIKCSENYKYLETKCYYVCPSGYQTSDNGLECVKANSKGSGQYLPFPHLIAAGLLGIITAAGQSRDGRALIISNLIVVINYTTISSYILQMVWASFDSVTIVVAITGVAVILQVLLNLGFIVAFKRTIELDAGFQLWITTHNCAKRSILSFSAIFTLQNARFFYSRFMGFAIFFVRFANFETVLHSLNCFSMAQILLVHCVVIILDILGLFKLAHGTKLYVSLIESLILSVILLILLLVEMRSSKNIKSDLEQDMTRYSQLKDPSVISPSMKPFDEEKIRKDILESIFKEIGMSSRQSIKTDSDIEDPLLNLTAKTNKTHTRPKRRHSFSQKTDYKKEKDTKKSGSYPCSPKTAKSKEVIMSNPIPEFDPSKLPNNVYSDAIPKKRINKPKKMVEFGIQTPPFQKIEMFKRHMRAQGKRKKKNKKLFEAEHAPKPLEVIQETVEDNDELMNEERKKPPKATEMITTEGKDDNQMNMKTTELKCVVVNKTETPLDESSMTTHNEKNVALNKKGNDKSLEDPIKKIAAFPAAGPSLADKDKSSPSKAKRPSSPPQDSNEPVIETMSKPLNPIAENKSEIVKDKKTLATPNKLPNVFDDNDGFKFSSAKLKGPENKTEAKTEAKKEQEVLKEEVHREETIKQEPASETKELCINDEDIMGTFEKDLKDGCILIMENADGVLVDVKGRTVNKYGYLIDKEGNIVNQQGQFVMSRIDFEKELEDEGELLPQNNKLFKEIDTNGQKKSCAIANVSEVEKKGNIVKEKEDVDSEERKSASLDSLMEDTPSNYNIQNQRYNDPLVALQQREIMAKCLPQPSEYEAEDVKANGIKPKRNTCNKSANKRKMDKIFKDVERKYSTDMAVEIEEPDAKEELVANSEAKDKPLTARNNARKEAEGERRARSRKAQDMDELNKAYNQNVETMFMEPDSDSFSVGSLAPSVASRVSNSKVKGLESIYLQRLESSSKHNKKIAEINRRKRKIKKTKVEKRNPQNNIEHDEISSLLSENYKAMEMQFKNNAIAENDTKQATTVNKAGGSRVHV